MPRNTPWPLVVDGRNLAVHRHGRAHDFAAEGLPHRLQAEADAEQRNVSRGLRDHLQADAGLVRRAGTGRQHDAIRPPRDQCVRRDLVIAHDRHLRPELAELVVEVPGEAVVVIDERDVGHANGLPRRLRASVNLSDGRAGRRQARRMDAAHCPRFAELANRTASSAARNSAFALLMHSCCSDCGSLSWTMPAPAWTCMRPFRTIAVRRTMQVSISPLPPK